MLETRMAQIVSLAPLIRDGDSLADKNSKILLYIVAIFTLLRIQVKQVRSMLEIKTARNHNCNQAKRN